MEGSHASNRSHRGSRGNKPQRELLFKQALFHAVSYLVYHQFINGMWCHGSNFTPVTSDSHMSLDVRRKKKSPSIKQDQPWVINKQSALLFVLNKQGGCEGTVGCYTYTHKETHYTLCLLLLCNPVQVHSTSVAGSSASDKSLEES